MSVKQRCRNCRYWDENGGLENAESAIDDRHGECVRHPPKVIGEVFSRIAALRGVGSGLSSPDMVDRASATIYPVTFGCMRCGEWVAARQKG
ncbi:MAG: hypothetical protein JOY99_01610 [Sphingomonadaceae bacterium]|nr:hypothetical protein [Sphingomonadaceae bacterium]